MELNDRHEEPLPPSDSSTGRDGCRVCGATLDVSNWYPTVGHWDSTGVYSLVRLCSRTCRTEWEAEHDQTH
jgi:hypothetical protein